MIEHPKITELKEDIAVGTGIPKQQLFGKAQKKLKILFINIDNSYGFSQKMRHCLKRLGHKVELILCLSSIVAYLNAKGNPQLRPTSFYSAMGNPFSIYELITFKGFDPEEFDIIFMEQAMFYYEKDVYDPYMGWNKYREFKTPVIYYHRDLWNECFIRFFDLLLYRFANHRTSLQYVSRAVWGNTPFKLQFLNAVSLKDWDYKKEKEYKGLNYVGTQRPLERYMVGDYVQRDYLIDTYAITEYCRNNDIATIHDYYKMKFAEYHYILERCEALLFIPGRNAYLSRRLYEAAACKCMLFIYVQSEFAPGIPNGFAKQQYEKILGLTHGLNCVMFDDMKKLKNLWIMYKNKRAKMVQKAYEWVQNRHTYDIRAKSLEKIFYQLIEKMEVRDKNDKEK